MDYRPIDEDGGLLPTLYELPRISVLHQLETIAASEDNISLYQVKFHVSEVWYSTVEVGSHHKIVGPMTKRFMKIDRISGTPRLPAFEACRQFPRSTFQQRHVLCHTKNTKTSVSIS